VDVGFEDGIIVGEVVGAGELVGDLVGAADGAFVGEVVGSGVVGGLSTLSSFGGV